MFGQGSRGAGEQRRRFAPAPLPLRPSARCSLAADRTGQAFHHGRGHKDDDHPDHQGSLPAVMEAAPGATAYAGEADIPDIRAPRPIVAVGDGDVVAGLEIIATPGHTPGHVAVLDGELSLLMAGDAMVGDAGDAGGPVPRFTTDLAQAHASVAKLAGLDFDAVVFGHGEPVLTGGTAAVAALAARL